MKKKIKQITQKCETCHANKHETILTPRLLQALAILEQAWSDIAMNFIEGFPLSWAYTIIMVVVD